MNKPYECPDCETKCSYPKEDENDQCCNCSGDYSGSENKVCPECLDTIVGRYDFKNEGENE